MWTGVRGMPPIANHRIFLSGGRISIFIHIHISLKAIKGLDEDGTSSIRVPIGLKCVLHWDYGNIKFSQATPEYFFV